MAKRSVETILKLKDESGPGFKSAEKNMDDLENKSGETGKKASLALAAIGAAAVLAAAKIATMATEVAAVGDELDKMSTRTDISVDSLSRWIFSTKLAGGSSATFEASVRRMTKSMYDAQQGLSTATRAWEKIGVAFQDSEGNLRSVDDVLFDLSDALAGMTNKTEKLAISQDILGRGASYMVGVLEQGSAELRNQSDEYDRLHGSMEKTAKAGAEWADAMLRLETAMNGIKENSLTPLINKLTPMAEEIANIVGQVENLGDALKATSYFLGIQTEHVLDFVEATDKASSNVSHLYGLLEKDQSFVDLDPEDSVQAMIAEFEELEAAMAAVKAMADETAEKILAAMEKSPEISKDFSFVPDELHEEVMQAVDDFEVLQSGVEGVADATADTSSAASQLGSAISSTFSTGVIDLFINKAKSLDDILLSVATSLLNVGLQLGISSLLSPVAAVAGVASSAAGSAGFIGPMPVSGVSGASGASQSLMAGQSASYVSPYDLPMGAAGAGNTILMNVGIPESRAGIVRMQDGVAELLDNRSKGII